MYIETVHTIPDERAFRAALTGGVLPAEIRLIATLTARDHSRVTVVWQADSVAALRTVLEARFGEVAETEYLELDEDACSGFGNPSPKSRPETDPARLHDIAKQLVELGRTNEALFLFRLNAEHNPDCWFTAVGLARGLAATGDRRRAAELLRTAVDEAPDHRQEHVRHLLRRLESGEDLQGHGLQPRRDRCPPAPEAPKIEGLLHVVLTRFNLGKPTNGEWLAHRCHLFERFCLPALRGQSCQHFTWLIFADARTPEPWRSRLLGYETANTRVIWARHEAESLSDILESRESSIYAQTVRGLLRGDEAVVLTTRCDNDDAVSFDFIETLQRAVGAGPEREFLNFPDGFVYHRGEVAPSVLLSNHFLSYREPPSEVRTVMQVKHPHAAQLGPMRNLADGRRYWVQVCHDQNLVNEPGSHVSGVWRPPEALAARFTLAFEPRR